MVPTQIERALEYAAAIVERSDDAIIAEDLDGTVVLWNAAATLLLGYSKEEMIGKSILPLIPEDRRQEETFIMQRMRRGEPVTELSTARLGKDGGAVNVTVAVAPVKADDSRLIGGVKTIRCVSDGSQAEERFCLVVEDAPNAIVVVDGLGRITLVNKQTEALFGYERKELIGQSIEILIPERHRTAHEGARREFHESSQTRAMSGRDLYGVRKDGTEVPVEIGLSPTATPTGPLVLASIIDITARKRADALLEQQRVELGRSNKDLEQFAYVASHDLQEPLRAISGFAEILQQRYAQQLDQRAGEYIRHVVEGCKRLGSLIDDLLAFSRIGRAQGNPRPTDGEEAVAVVLRNLSASIEESGAQITRDALPVVRVGPSQFVMLVQNLVGNAIKFRHPSKTPQIHIGVRKEGGRATFSVQDNGIGIAPEHFERIFSVFQRLHTRTEYPGTGIGLSICKRIVEFNGGRIWVESAQGRGATFYFDLPLESKE
jgi:PAS domain S-box-containing protein